MHLVELVWFSPLEGFTPNIPISASGSCRHQKCERRGVRIFNVANSLPPFPFGEGVNREGW